MQDNLTHWLRIKIHFNDEVPYEIFILIGFWIKCLHIIHLSRDKQFEFQNFCFFHNLGRYNYERFKLKIYFIFKLFTYESVGGVWPRSREKRRDYPMLDVIITANDSFALHFWIMVSWGSGLGCFSQFVSWKICENTSCTIEDTFESSISLFRDCLWDKWIGFIRFLSIILYWCARSHWALVVCCNENIDSFG